MLKGSDYLKIYQQLDWDSYISIVQELMTIEKDNLEHELLCQARLYSYWTGLLTLAKKDYDRIKRSIETTEALLKNDLMRTNTKLSDKKLDLKVKEKEEYITLLKELENQNYKLGLFQNIVKALEQRKDMLVQISSNRKKELSLHS